MEKQVVAIKDMSAGNESVGEMWQETKIFSLDTPVSEIIDWAMVNGSLRKRLTLTVAE